MAGESARHGTAVVTLEPCSHQGRTPPCTDALIRAGVSRVVVGLLDPDPRVNGSGIRALEAAGTEVELGVKAEAAAHQLRAYLHHRRTGRPYVVLKLAATLDGRIAAPDGSSRWITGDEARADAHRLRADSDAVLVGAGTVRADDPELTVRTGSGPDPMRIVLGTASADALVQPAVEVSGTPEEVLRELSGKGILQLLIEGGASVAAQFHRAGLVDRYVLYLAPALIGGEGGMPLMTGVGAWTMAEIWRGRFEGAERLGEDLRIDIVPTDPTNS
jgi:diaminohydroxyphosphoribosylaminopyrimidine deaminase/5-amino-6-(5-phosphoribosylamino)uracil reductase